MRYIEDFKEGDSVVGHFLCKRKISGKTRSGKSYLSLTLFDKTGSIEAKVWEMGNHIQSFEENDFIKVDGEVQAYNNELQFKINRIRKSLDGEYTASDYIPSTDKNIDSIINQLYEYIQSLSNSYLKRLLEAIVINNETISHNLKLHSAAKNMHHSYMGGLAEHTLSVVQICDFMSGRYKYVNRDLLITCAMLHDLGKIFELSPFPENDYTDEGQLLGHIVIMSMLINDEASKINGFPEKLKNLVIHCILSHHGEYEFASPTLPKIIEAFILHCADNSDAKIKMFEETIEKDNTLGSWVGYHRMLARNIRKSDF